MKNIPVKYEEYDDLHKLLKVNISIMTSSVHIAKYANILNRYKTNMSSLMSNIFIPALRERQNEITEVIKEKSSKLLPTDIAQKMRTAKGFYRLEMAPPSLDEKKKMLEDIELVKEFIKKGCFKYITVKQAWLMFLVCMEIGLWFFLGETIGKFHIVGYKV